MLFDFFDPETEILNGIAQFKPAFDFETPDGVTPNKFIASSALQKALRRKNLQQAVFAAAVLRQIDEGYLFRRLKLIALEDHFADLNVVAQVLWVGGRQDWIRRNAGSDKVLAYLLHQLCNSKACRALDESLYACLHPLYKHQRQIFSGMSKDELFDKFTDKSLDCIEQTLICWFLCGTRYPCSDLDLKQGNPNLLLDLCYGLGVPDFVTDVLKLSRQFEFFVSLFPSWLMMEGSQTTSVKNEAKDKPVMIGGYPSESYDRHTLPGKKAFRLFLKQCPEVSVFLQKHVPEANHVDLIGWAVFILEGQLLNKRLIYGGTVCLQGLAEQSWLLTGGMKIELQEEFINLMKQHMGKLHDARR